MQGEDVRREDARRGCEERGCKGEGVRGDVRREGARGENMEHTCNFSSTDFVSSCREQHSIEPTNSPHETTHHTCLKIWTYHFIHDGRYLVVLPI